jgi:ABC-type lipoprotein export system ATPase subunit
MASNYPRGSEWRKWDLHVHTPFSYLNNQYGNPENSDTWDMYVKRLFEKAIEKNIAVIGITDYFIIDGYKKIKNEYLANESKLRSLFDNDEAKLQAIKNILVLPNIEFRLNKLVGNQSINFHVIFSNGVNIDDIEGNFLNEIKFVYEGSPQTEDEERTLNKQNLTILGRKLKQQHSNFTSKSDIEVGMMNVVVNDEAIVKILSNKKSIFEGKYLLFIPADEDLSDISWNGQDHQTRKVLIQKCDGLFASNPNTIQWALGYRHQGENRIEQINNFVNEFKSLKPCVWGSDAHSFNRLFEPDQNRYTWIKADPTFEGLKQIIYEPEERVTIQENNPEYDFDKPTFSKISITQPLEVFNDEKVKFDKTELPLNKNLVTIIGGRGTGKSIMLNYIANTLKKEILAYKRKENPAGFKGSDNFIVECQKNNIPNPEIITFNAKDKGDLDLIFIEQGKLKNTSDYRMLAAEIKKLLRIETLQFDEKLDKEISELLDDVKKLKEWFEYKNEKGEKSNDRKFNESKKQEAENLLKTITTEDNKKNIDIYTSNIKTIKNCENILTTLNGIKSSLAKFQANTNNTINNINSDIEKEINDLSIPKIDFESQCSAIRNIEEKVTEVIKNKKKENSEIKNEFEKQGYKGDLETLLWSAEKYQKDIQDAELKLKEIEERERQLNERIQQRNNLVDKLKEEYERQKNEIDGEWNNLLNRFSEEQRKVMSKILERREISINGIVNFDLKKFDEKLREYLDLRIYKNLSKDLGISSLDDYWKFINEELKNFIEGEKAETIKKDLGNLCFNLQERKDYLCVVPEIRFMNKTLDQLSVGQRGTLYLLLQLATNAFSSPLMFDQPEDDLDNEFITTELVGLFKELKRYRQIIISTHNANLVVTADAEQVIVANNNDETLSYFSGSLENKDIVEKVCTILEGGKTAFENRRNKYGIK